jgi:hypothetical protein
MTFFPAACYVAFRPGVRQARFEQLGTANGLT